jgi:hypothetical protein
MKDWILVSVTEVLDSEINSIEAGELDYSIWSGRLENYLKQYGEKGKTAIQNKLKFLSDDIERRFNEVKND